jgi:glycerate dehydrogenase
MMKIVILDTQTLTGEDLDWAALDGLGERQVFAHTTPDQLLDRAAGAEVLLTNKVRLSAETLAQLPQLRYVGVTATGYDMVDLDAARQQGIVVTNAAGYGTEAVAQHVFALLLALTNQVARHSADVHQGGWTQQGSWTYRLTPLQALTGMTLGIVGLGRIGQAAGRLGAAFGMRVLGHSRRPHDLPGIEGVGELATLLAQSDVVSLHCPLTAETQGLLDAKRLALMKPSAYLINTARGPLIDEVALAEALRQGRLAGAGLDVLSQEPPPADHPLVGLPQCLITPHNAWGAQSARQRLIDQAADNLRAWQAGKPQGVVT